MRLEAVGEAPARDEVTHQRLPAKLVHALREAREGKRKGREGSQSVEYSPRRPATHTAACVRTRQKPTISGKQLAGDCRRKQTVVAATFFFLAPAQF